ncbi:UNVERIFIED_ORG: hypothetical protein BDK47_10370 [Anoxybacillus amylolyticus]|uniref:Response regulatory domain-containing protein n=1 Tax=Geobacillus thermopakistaniensis (strain MAS1) TaxID=1408282 RepID=A0A7U9JCU8_GEOTM|nr:hypothetical protein GT3570_11165 [Geobacillus thermoleovorans]EQB95739.1 hypothetical protein GA8_10230 [Geobacillus sp. A8]ESU73247.1 hypothetical protein T260_03915 [Geobacillus sp. MAS1]KFL16776.1 hypothetical protein ET31_04270 [Geobacillus stearothermophilus]AOL35085.1 hypothetical protein BGM21_11530 [Geobacillus thermoleovorans]
MNILLIEDDVTLFQEIKARLEQWSYDVCGIRDFGRVMEEFSACKPHLGKLSFHQAPKNP